jgi:thiol-disulfide isomerase/thioredoxin
LEIAGIVDRLLESGKFLAEFRALELNCNKQIQAIGERTLAALEAAKTDRDRETINRRFAVGAQAILDPALPKALALVQPHAAEPVSAGPLKWIMSQSEADSETFKTALALLVKYHLTNQQILDMARSNRLSGSAWVEPLLRAQIASDALRPAQRAKQMLALAGYLQQAAELHPSQAEQFQREAIGLFTELAEKYPNQELVPGRTIGAMARGGLFAIKHLGIGKRAPDIEGEDLEGVSLKLSDYRGKVVVLSFWASWCFPCMEMVPHERELVEQYQGKPFVLLGVNADPDREQLKTVLKEHRITWRSFWCGEKGPSGAIPMTWNVQSWPSVYVLDSAGVIRAKNVLGKALDKKVAELVAEAEKASPPNR